MKDIYKILIVILTTVSLTSCDDRLDQAPISDLGNNNFYTNESELETAVVAIYDGLQATVQREFALTEMRSDNTRTKNSEGSWAEFQNMSVNPTNSVILDYWQTQYNVIHRANTVLANLDVVASESVRNQFEGEAKFTRALAHFNLTRAFGDVPLIDRVVYPSDQDYFSQKPQADVLQFIADDLEEAMLKLPARGGIEEGRATAGAATSLLAKVYLTQGEHAQAKSLLDQVISSSNYSLQENYRDVFYNENNSEIIFAIKFVGDNAFDSQDFSFEMTKGGQASGLNYITDDFKSAVNASDTERMAVLYSPNDPDEVGKFLTASSNVRQCGNDWIVLRYADVLLMHVEAIMGDATSTSDMGAITSFNAIRSRSGLPTIATDGSGEITQEMLLEERRIELAFENHRLYDLIRFDVAEQVMAEYADEADFNFSPTDLKLPIPQVEINASLGALTQNLGYN